MIVLAAAAATLFSVGSVAAADNLHSVRDLSSETLREYAPRGRHLRRGAERGYWVETMVRIVRPVYENLARGTLRRNMPVEVNDGTNEGKRADVTHLEALGRSFNGIAPWLALGAEDTAEGRLRAEMTDLVVRAISNAVDPDSPDYMPLTARAGSLWSMPHSLPRACCARRMPYGRVWIR